MKKKGSTDKNNKEEESIEDLESFVLTSKRNELEDFKNEIIIEENIENNKEGNQYIFNIPEVNSPHYYSQILDQIKEDFDFYETPIDILLSINKPKNSKYKLDLIDGIDPVKLIENNKNEAEKLKNKVGFNINEKVIEQIIYNELARIRYIVQEQDRIEEKDFENELLTRILNHNFSTDDNKDALLIMPEYEYVINKEDWLPTARFWLYNGIISLEDVEIIDYQDIFKNILDEMLFLKDSEVRVVLLNSNSSIKSMDEKEVLFEALITIDGILYNAYLGYGIDGLNLSLFDVR